MTIRTLAVLALLPGCAGVPDGVYDFMTEEQIAEMEDAGFDVHRGKHPPDVEGTFLADSQEIAWDERDQVLNLAPLTLVFHGQTDDGAISVSYEQAGGSALGDGSFVSGDGACFTIYADVHGESDGCTYAMPLMYSGCLDAEGIWDFQNGLIMGEKSGTCDHLIDEGHRRVIIESDGLAARVD